MKLYWKFRGWIDTQIKYWTFYKLIKASGNKVYIETGSEWGRSIILARRAGFKEIHGIELDPKYLSHCKKHFAKHDFIHMHFGNSGETLAEVLKRINRPATIWLDAHGGPDDPCPLLEELAAIRGHQIKTHMILIDDVRYLGKSAWPSRKTVLLRLFEINPGYEFTYHRGRQDNDILMAKI